MTGQMHNAEASDPNQGRVPLPDLALVDGPANSTAAIDPALPLTLNQLERTTNESSSLFLPGEARTEAPGSLTVETRNVIPSSQRQQASTLHPRSEITLLSRQEVRDLTPVAAAAAHQEQGLAVRRGIGNQRAASINRDGDETSGITNSDPLSNNVDFICSHWKPEGRWNVRCCSLNV